MYLLVCQNYVLHVIKQQNYKFHQVMLFLLVKEQKVSL